MTDDTKAVLLISAVLILLLTAMMFAAQTELG